MNPAALKTNIADLKTNGILIVNTDNFKETDLKKAQIERRTRSRTTRSTATGSSRSSSPSSRAPRSRTSASTPRAWTAARTSSRSACATGSTTGSMDATLRVARRQVQEQAGAGRGQQARHEGGLRVLRRDRGVPGQLRGPAREAGARASTATSAATRALALGFVAASQQLGPAALPGQLPDHARLRHPARALDVQGLRRDDVPGRGRDRGHHLGDRRRLRRRARHHHHLGPGHGAEDGGHRPRHRDRAAARDLRHPARRAVHRPADQDRAGRPAAGALRPQLRGAGAGARRRHAGRLLLGRASRRAASRSSTWCR